jgi:hypothetical protein
LEIADIGVGRAGDEKIVQGQKKCVRVVVGEKSGGRADARGFGAREAG